MKKHEAAGESTKNGTVTGQWIKKPAPRTSKTHQDYWKSKVVRRSYLGSDGEMVTPPEYSVRMRHMKGDVWFNLHTASVASASIKARDIYLSLVSSGWEKTLEIYKPKAKEPDKVCTVGEFIKEVAKKSHLKPATARNYSIKLRKLVADIAKLSTGTKGKSRNSKYNWIGDGRTKWVTKIESQSMSILTTDALIGWRNAYVNRVGSDPIKRKSAQRTSASILRCTKAMFSEDITKLLKLPLPPNPFDGLKVPQPGPARYLSDVNPEWLLSAAERELKKKDPQAYLGFTLCLWAGLRRKEADLLTWAQLDLANGELQIRRTSHFEPKTDESQRNIDLAPFAVEVLRKAMKNSTTEFVLNGSEPHPEATYDYYRCDHTWRRLLEWLRGKGVKQIKAIHMLRKESGSLIASTFGIEAARQHLGHRDISTTSAHYVTKKRRVEVSLGGGELKALEEIS